MKAMAFHITEVKEAFVIVARIVENGSKVVSSGPNDSSIEN